MVHLNYILILIPNIQQVPWLINGDKLNMAKKSAFFCLCSVLTVHRRVGVSLEEKIAKLCEKSRLNVKCTVFCIHHFCWIFFCFFVLYRAAIICCFCFNENVAFELYCDFDS